jgi:tRNA modification GTPase
MITAEHDTIAAIATPAGFSGIGVIRLSGPQSTAILKKIFKFPGQKKEPFRSRVVYTGSVGTSAETIDQAVAVYMQAPRSYTGEDTAEISVHGSPIVLGRVLHLALAAGARLADP